MAVPLFHSNQIVWFRTSYNDGIDDFTKYRPWLLKEVNEQEKLLVFFPITSNRTHYKIFVSQFAILNRPPCLSKKILYPQSFVNTNRLVAVPQEVSKYLDFCQTCSLTCLEKEEFAGVLKLHYNLSKYQIIKIRKIILTKEDFNF